MPDVVEYRQARLARLLRHLKRHISNYIDTVLGDTEQGAKWNPAVAAAQILLVRAWLRGVVLPTAPATEQWVALLRDESAAESAPAARTAKWGSLLSSTNQQHVSLRTLLRESLSLPQGGSKEFGLGSGLATAAILRLIEKLEFIDVPEKILTQTEARKIIETAAEQLVNARDVLPVMMNDEQRRLDERSTRLRSLLRDRSLRAHGERLDAAVNAASTALSGVAFDRVRDWKNAYEGVKGYLAEDSGALQATLEDFDEADQEDPFAGVIEEVPKTSAETLATLVKAQAAQLESVSAAFSNGETVITLLADAAFATVEESGPIAGLEVIHAQGAELAAGARTITTLLRAARSA